jgi:hypothetical protein
MKLQARNVVWLLPLLLTACFHKPHETQNQQFAPPVSTVPKPPVEHPQLPLSALTLPSESVDSDADDILDEAAKPVQHRHRTVAKVTAPEAPETAAPTPPANPQQASNAGEESEVPAVGVLSSSSGDPIDLRRETTDSISDTERGLKDLVGRKLNGQEEKTATQIRQFIREARKALNSGDVDGAHTLAAKARVLLGELSE